MSYVKRVAQKVAGNSDLQVPLQMTVLNSKEINAFALPGGFVFIERGILEAVDDQSQLAGVIAHEMSHALARHGHKLMTKATITSIIYQAAQVAAVILTGGRRASAPPMRCNTGSTALALRSISRCSV